MKLAAGVGCWTADSPRLSSSAAVTVTSRNNEIMSHHVKHALESPATSGQSARTRSRGEAFSPKALQLQPSCFNVDGRHETEPPLMIGDSATVHANDCLLELRLQPETNSFHWAEPNLKPSMRRLLLDWCVTSPLNTYVPTPAEANNKKRVCCLHSGWCTCTTISSDQID